MQASVIFYSKSGTTKQMAEKICEGLISNGVEAKAISISELDKKWIQDSSCIIIGSPTYYADISAKVKEFLENLGSLSVADKLGGAFATSAYSYGGGDIALQTIQTHMLFWGMLVYSGGCSQGNPPIHLGPVYAGEQSNGTPEVFHLYGQRMAQKCIELFDPNTNQD